MVQAPQAPVTTPSARRWSLTPTLEQVRQIAAADTSARTVPIFRETMADLETPVSAFLKVRGDGPAFLLESIEGGERLARYSFIGANPVALLCLADGEARLAPADDERIEPYDDPLTPLQRLVDRYRSADVAGTTLPRFVGGAVGYLSYEAVRAFEPRVGAAPGAGLGLPDAAFMLVDSILVFDHLARTIKAVAHVHLDGQTSIDAAYGDAAARVDAAIALLRAPTPPLPGGRDRLPGSVESRCLPNTTPERYQAMVERAREYIAAGDIFQVVLSQRVDVPTSAHPFSVYRAFRTVNPSPYMFYLDFNDHQIVGASPEMLVRLEGRTLSYHPIAGTRPRGAGDEEDQVLERDLLADEK